MVLACVSKQYANSENCRMEIQFAVKVKMHRTKTGVIAGFHSRDQQPCFSTKTKGSVCIIILIELNSQRIWSGHQHGRLFFV